MQQPTEILLIGNSNSDSKLLLDELRKGDFNATWLRFESEQQLSRALTSKQWNVLIVYFAVSGFKEIDIIKNIRTLKPTLPCFVVSETGEEDFIVKAIKAGAVDFISKKRLNRLVPAIKQALAESCCLKNGDKIEDELTKSKARYSTLFKESPVPLWEENLSQVKKYQIGRAHV